MNLWHTRSQSMNCLDSELAAEKVLLDREFQLLEYVAQKLMSATPPSAFARVGAASVTKARNLLHCQFSLALDAHSQEAGAIGRVFVECVELLAYLNGDPERVREAIDGRLPSAGIRAERIGSKMKRLRDYWNEHAAHFSVSFESISHVVDAINGKIVSRQPFKKHVLRHNLETVAVFAYMAGVQSMLCLEAATKKRQPEVHRALIEIRDECGRLFNLERDAV